MKAVYILLVIVVAAAALGCVGKKGTEPSTIAQVTNTAPAPTPSTTVSETEVLDTGGDLAEMDTMFNEASLDISFSDVSADALT